MKLRIPIVPILEFLRFEFGGLLQQKKILDSNLDLLLNCFAWFMEGSIVYLCDVSIEILLQIHTYVNSKWYTAKKKLLAVAVDMLLFVIFAKPGPKPIRIFTEWKEKIIYMHRLCDGLAAAVEILSSSQLLPPLMEFFFLFQIGLPGRVTNQLKSRSRAYFTFRACYIAGVSFMYLTYTTENTPVRWKNYNL